MPREWREAAWGSVGWQVLVGRARGRGTSGHAGLGWAGCRAGLEPSAGAGGGEGLGQERVGGWAQALWGAPAKPILARPQGKLGPMLLHLTERSGRPNTKYSNREPLKSLVIPENRGDRNCVNRSRWLDNRVPFATVSHKVFNKERDTSIFAETKSAPWQKATRRRVLCTGNVGEGSDNGSSLKMVCQQGAPLFSNLTLTHLVSGCPTCEISLWISQQCFP